MRDFKQAFVASGTKSTWHNTLSETSMKLSKTLFGLLSFFLFTAFNGNANSYVYFFDSPQSDYYENSWLEVTSPSELEHGGSSDRRFPVETVARPFMGTNCLRLSWRSVNGGSWVAISAGKYWQPHDISAADKISFWVYSQTDLAAIYLPKIFIEDMANKRSAKISLLPYSVNIPANQWTRITVPMSAFYNAADKVDFTQVKTVGFAQDLADGDAHTLFVDNIKVIYRYTNQSASTPIGLQPKGYDSHAFLQWNHNPESGCNGYNIYLSTDGVNYKSRSIDFLSADDTCYTDFVRSLGHNLDLSYKITAFNDDDAESTASAVVSCNTHDMTDEELLTMVQEATFRYFWEYANPVSGLARESNFHSTEICTLGGSGFGVMAILAAIERGFITREQGLERVTKIVNFLKTADRFHGAWPHWVNGYTGKVIPFSDKDNGGDLVETSFMIEGLLTARQYFTGANPAEKTLAQDITTLWEGVEWDWYRRGGQNVLYWHWSPDYGWAMNFAMHGYMETLITYILAVASPTHPVPASLYHNGWACCNYKNTRTFYGIKMDVGHDYGGPLFWEHYSFLGFDPRSKKDAYTNYFRNSTAICLINHAFCIDNPNQYSGYSDKCWGLSACLGPTGYDAFEPTNDNGTIAPPATVASIVYTPANSINALKYFYREKGDLTWGDMGFKESFNLTQDWYNQYYYSIDQGPVIDMIENYRSQMLWNNFMANPEISTALDKIGFVADTANTPVHVSNSTGKYEKSRNPYQLTVTPNPVSGSVVATFVLPAAMKTTLELLDISQKVVLKAFEDKVCLAGDNIIPLNTSGISTGIYVLRLRTDRAMDTAKVVVAR